jgi:two-component system cell cycle response regulator CtrA
MRILIIEDNTSTSMTISLALKKHGMLTDIAELGQEGLETSSLYDYDLVILDIMLPDANGIDILKQLRHARSSVPVLILSGLGTPEEKIKGLISGADDYLTKPFNADELVARVKAIVRRSQGHAASIIKIGDLEINLDEHSTYINKKNVNLTLKEQSVLEILALKKGMVVTKEIFFDHLYNGMDEPDFKIIDVFICKLRKKLMESSGGKNYIETAWGRGYLMRSSSVEAETSSLGL